MSSNGHAQSHLPLDLEICHRYDEGLAVLHVFCPNSLEADMYSEVAAV